MTNDNRINIPNLPNEVSSELDQDDMTGIFKKIFIISGLIFLGVTVGIIFSLMLDNKNSKTPKLTMLKPTVTTIQMTTTPTIKIEPTQTPVKPTSSPITIAPTPTSTPQPYSIEEKMLRKVIANFEMFIGNSNTSGALKYFTPAKSESAKQKYDSIKANNLDFRLKSWKFVTDSEYLILAKEIKGGYQVDVFECRTNEINCKTLTLEMVRNEKAENGFLIDKYYFGNKELGVTSEEIKYQGFGL